jgi:hypothetical protein
MACVVAVALALSFKHVVKLNALLSCPPASAFQFVCEKPNADLCVRRHD